jgi:hypothetical protein
MNTKLLDIPQRRFTPVPELIRFFRDRNEATWEDDVMAFLRAFSGTQIDMPGPEFFEEMVRDEAVIGKLKNDCSAENILRVIREHNITYEYLENLWRVVMDRNLDPTAGMSRQKCIEAAVDMAAKHPPRVNTIIDMFKLNAAERAQINLPERRRCKQKKIKITDPQRRMIRYLRGRDRFRATKNQLREHLGRSVSVATLDALERAGLISIATNGKYVTLTASGRDV